MTNRINFLVDFSKQWVISQTIRIQFQQLWIHPSNTATTYRVLITNLRMLLAQALSRCSHCLWHLVTSQTPPPVSSQVGHDHLHMPGEQHHDHPTSVEHKLWHSGQRDSELVNSSHCPPHSGPLCFLWAVHRQSFDGLSYKPTGSSHGDSEGRLVDMTLPLCAKCKLLQANTVEWWQLTSVDRLDVQSLRYKCKCHFTGHRAHVGNRDILHCTSQWVVSLGGNHRQRVQ